MLKNATYYEIPLLTEYLKEAFRGRKFNFTFERFSSGNDTRAKSLARILKQCCLLVFWILQFLTSDYNGLGVQIENKETEKHKQEIDAYELICKPQKCILKKID